MNQLKKLFAVAALTACVLPVAAQYPVIPDSVKIRGEEQQKEIDRKSDEAWAKALPVVMSEAVQGRPYKPWASKPEDLIKSNIPAFPGAEGGGAYTPGGRGGKVIVVNSLADSGPGTLREACETGRAYCCIQCFGRYPAENPYKRPCSVYHYCRSDSSGGWGLCNRSLFPA